jgi:hypothetical protein
MITATCQKGNPREIAAFESLRCPAAYSPLRAFSLRIVLARRPVPIVAVLDQRIAWQSVDGSTNSGTITFDKRSSDWTRVNATFKLS